MSEDELMEALGETARDRDLDERWDELAAGELSDDELAALRAETGDDAEALEAAFAPLGADDQEDFVAAILGGGQAPSVAADAATADLVAAGGTGSRAVAGSGARGVSGSRGRFVLGAVGVAAVAAVALFVWLPSGTPALPTYAAAVHGGAQIERGEAEATGRFRAEDRVELRLRPETDVSVPIHAAIFRAAEGGHAERVNLPLDVAATGAVRLSVSARELLPGEGDFEVTIVVAPARMPIERANQDGVARAVFRLVRDDGL